MRPAARLAVPLAVASAAAVLSSASGLARDRNPGRLSATAVLKDAEGATRARAQFVQLPQGVQLTVVARGMKPGTYGIHVHTTGRCDAPSFTSAGGHWNPTARQHGTDNPAGAHMGDLPNLRVEADGNGTLVAALDQARLTSGPAPMLDGDGAALMIHAGPDDGRSDPAGDSGARIACGVITAK